MGGQEAPLPGRLLAGRWPPAPARSCLGHGVVSGVALAAWLAATSLLTPSAPSWAAQLTEVCQMQCLSSLLLLGLVPFAPAC